MIKIYKQVFRMVTVVSSIWWNGVRNKFLVNNQLSFTPSSCHLGADFDIDWTATWVGSRNELIDQNGSSGPTEREYLGSSNMECLFLWSLIFLNLCNIGLCSTRWHEFSMTVKNFKFHRRFDNALKFKKVHIFSRMPNHRTC